MKLLFLFTFISFSSNIYAANDWKVVALTTSSCKESIQVLAKEGEKFVYVLENNLKTKLMAEDGSSYSQQSGKEVVYSNAKFTFIQPSVINGNPPKLTVSMNGATEKCRMNLQ